MIKYLKFIISNLMINFSLLTLLIIGIQNSSVSKKVDLIFFETIFLPISFISGSSFILGSLTGSIVSLNLNKNKN